MEEAMERSESAEHAVDRDAVWRRHDDILIALSQTGEREERDLALAFGKLTAACAAGVGVARCSIWLFDERRTSIVCEDLFELATSQHSRGLVLMASDYPRYFAALTENRTISATDARTHAATSEFAEGYLAPLGIRSMLEAPIRRQGRVAGVVCSEHVGDARTFSREDQMLAAGIADLASRALEASERRRAEDRLVEANEALARHKAELERTVEERTAALAASDTENRELIDRLRVAVDQLSTPVLELWDDVLALPVIGLLDSARAASMTERVLHEVTSRRARVVVVDLTGVDLVDTGTADRMASLTRAIQLLGARSVITGLQPAVAQTLVDLGADLGKVPLFRTLKDGLVHAMELTRGRRLALRR